MPRTVYLIVYNSPLFPAHWALWIPRASPPNLGKLIHATGDARNGFTIAFERNYDINGTTRAYQIIPLAQVLDHYAVDGTGTKQRMTISSKLRSAFPHQAQAWSRLLVRYVSSFFCSRALQHILISMTLGTKAKSNNFKLSDMAPTSRGCAGTEWCHGRRSHTDYRQCPQELTGK